MDHMFIAAPTQIKLINDVIFDVTGLPVGLVEIAAFAVVAVIAKVFINAPFARNI